MAGFHFTKVKLMDFHQNDNLKNSILEGIFAHMFATLTGGVFLTGFALYLGMDEFMIGLLASMPFLVTILQLPVSRIMERNGRRKDFWYWSSAAARLLWIPILLLGLSPLPAFPEKSFLVLGVIFISYCCSSVSGVAWLSLMSDLAPEGKRGSFFGTRNMLCGAAGMTAMIVFGKLLDYSERHLPNGLSLGFAFAFFSAALLGAFSLRFLNRVTDPGAARVAVARPFYRDFVIPFREANFRKFLGFAFTWSFSVYFAAPFFTLYFLQHLNFSYGFIAALGTISGFADLLGMRLWGRLSDKTKNKAVIRFSSWVAIFLPFAWVFVRPGSYVAPIIINFVGGGFWAGINLCMNNLLLGISPKENRSLFLSMYSIFAGVGAATSPILAGLLLKSMTSISVLHWTVLPLHIVFLISTMLRLVSFQLFRRVREPEEVGVGQMVRVLKGVRGLNVASGFNYLLHPFIEIAKNNGGKGYGKTLHRVESPATSSTRGNAS